MKQHRRIFLYLCLCFIAFIIAIIGVQPGTRKSKKPDLVTQRVNIPTDHRLSRETVDGINNTTEKELTREEKPLKFKADYWHNHTRFACKSLGMSTDVSKDQGNLQAIVDDKHKLIICPIAKAGSSYLGRVFAILLGQDPAKDPKYVNGKVAYSKYMGRQPKLGSFSNEGRLKRLKTFYSAVLVREPFGRLLSAYRDKIEKPWSNYYANVAKKMRKSRKGKTFTTFPDFVSYLVNSKDDKDLHWKPYYEACSPCSMEYDFVAKMETMHEDMKHIFEEVNVTDIIVPPKPAIKTADAYLEKYYKQVPKRTLRKLYERYKPDFLIFNYSIPEAIKIMMT